MTIDSLAALRRRVTTDWQDDPDVPPACRGKPLDFFFPVEVDASGDEREPAYAPPATRAICNACPHQANCLEWALVTGEEFGIYGGKTGYERMLMRTPKRRVYCLGCGSDAVIREYDNQVCLACGTSWPYL